MGNIITDARSIRHIYRPQESYLRRDQDGCFYMHSVDEVTDARRWVRTTQE